MESNKRGVVGMTSKKRWIWIVLDSVGCGAAPDASHYGTSDEMSNTLAHIAQAKGGLYVPNMEKLGLGNILEIEGVKPSHQPTAYGRMQEKSHGKDTTNGHWEFVGVVLEQDLPVYPNGFPNEIIQPFEAYVGKPVLCNRPASGTEVIEEYGAIHMETGRPIVYTSADSVFQIAAHEEIVTVQQLYDWCEKARALLTGPHAVGRVIARPFIGKPGAFQRTHHRKDFSLNFGHTVLNSLQTAGWDIIGIGKIYDIYGGSGISKGIHTDNNEDGMKKLLQAMREYSSGLLYINLVDFDSLYGHRNNPIGFAQAVEEFDRWLGKVLSTMQDSDVLCITADHGCDPTTPGTDHSREWVPLLVYHKQMNQLHSLGDRSTFADLGATVAEFFGVSLPEIGESFWKSIQDEAMF